MKFLPIYLLFFVLLMTSMNRKKNTIRSISVSQIIQRKDSTVMLESAKKFIGTKCIIKTIDGSSLHGKLREVSEKALILETTDGRANAINVDYIINIEEYPTSKKEKSSVFRQFFFEE